MTPGPPEGMDAVVLAGGRGTRVDGAAKALFEVGGRTLLSAAVHAVRGAGARRVTVAGPVLDARLPVDWVREEPVFGGPVAGIVAVLDWWDAADDREWTLVLACDLPGVDSAVRYLGRALAGAPPDVDGVCLTDGERPQWLTAAYRTCALRRAASALPDRGRDASVRALVAALAVTPVAAPGDVLRDVDTWDDLTRARDAAGAARIPLPEGFPVTDASRTLPPEALDAWAARLREEFGLAEADVPVAAVLDMTRIVAHAVARPAAPLGAFVAGLAAGRAGTDAAAITAALERVAALAEDAAAPE